ncbi:hypothetical protein BHM03_00014361 [Ensete ventricosum]|nr:hypothetical protein BHM03_00014361 [Ensete ventricosum]
MCLGGPLHSFCRETGLSAPRLPYKCNPKSGAALAAQRCCLAACVSCFAASGLSAGTDALYVIACRRRTICYSLSALGVRQYV